MLTSCCNFSLHHVSEYFIDHKGTTVILETTLLINFIQVYMYICCFNILEFSAMADTCELLIDVEQWELLIQRCFYT